MVDAQRSELLVRRLVDLVMAPGAPARKRGEAGRALNMASLLSAGGQDEAALALLETACSRLGVSDIDMLFPRAKKGRGGSRRPRGQKDAAG